MRLSNAALAGLAPVFSAGVGIETTAGISLLALLCGQLGIASDYVDQRVQTIFHNGRAVDRTETVRVNAGDVIALSAAMPGLAGATLRKGGVLAAFRREISYADNTVQPGAHKKVMITLKLFNLVARELCPLMLAHGVWIECRAITEHLQQFDASAPSATHDMIYNGRPTTPGEMAHLCRPGERIFLSVAAPLTQKPAYRT